MDTTSIKEQILKVMRESLIHKDDEPIPEKYELNFDKSEFNAEYPDLIFVEKFINKGGNFILCENSSILIEKVKSFFYDKKLNSIFCNDTQLGEVLEVCGVTSYDKNLVTTPYDYMVMPVDSLVAETGSIILSTKTTKIEHLQKHTNHLVLIALTNQVKAANKEAILNIAKNNTNTFPAQTLIISDYSFDKQMKVTLFLRYVC